MAIHRALAAAMLLLSLASPAAAAGANDPELATIGSSSIRVSDFVDAYLDITESNRPDLTVPGARREFLDNLVHRELLMAEAKRLKIEEDPGFKRDADALRLNAVDAVLLDELMRDVPPPTGQAIQEMTDHLGQRYHVHLLNTTDSSRAAEALTWLHAGRSWVEVERMWRDLDYGEFEDRDTEQAQFMPYETRDILFALEPGEASDIIRVFGDYEIIYLESREEVSAEDPAERVRLAQTTLEQDARMRALNAFVEERRTAAGYTVDNLLVRKVARRFRETAEPGTVPGFDLSRWPDFTADAGNFLATWEGGGITLEEFLIRLAAFPDEARPDLGRERQIRVRLAHFSADQFRLEEARRLGLFEREEVALQVKRTVERRLMRVVRDQLVAGTVVPEDSVRAYYDRYQADITLPAEYQAQLIVAPDSSMAEDYRLRIVSGYDFKTLARPNSIHRESAAKGGELGWIAYDAYPELLPMLVRMKPGDVGEPIRALGGFAVVQVLDARGKRPATYEEARAAVAMKITTLFEDRRLGEWLEQQKAAAKVRIFDDRLAAISLTDPK